MRCCNNKQNSSMKSLSSASVLRRTLLHEGHLNAAGPASADGMTFGLVWAVDFIRKLVHCTQKGHMETMNFSVYSLGLIIFGFNMETNVVSSSDTNSTVRNVSECETTPK